MGINDSNATNALDESIVADILTTNTGIQGALTVGTSAVLAAVGVGNLANRKVLSIFHNGTGNLFWGYTNGVTIATGIQIFRNTMVTFNVSMNTNIYLVASAAGQNVRVSEGA